MLVIDRVLRASCAALLALSAAAAPLAAQAAASRAPVTLRVQPRVGDTISMRVEVTEDVTVRGRINEADTTISRRSQRLMLSRSVVQQSSDQGAAVLTVIDSVAVSEGDGASIRYDLATQRAMKGKRFRTRLSPDGAAALIDAELSSPQLAATFASMPSTLPTRAVSVGDTWSMSMTMPRTGDADSTPGGVLRTTFRLDSVSRVTDVAYISVHGTLGHASPSAHGERSDAEGQVTGSMQFDRRRGWLTDTRTTVTMRGTMPRPAGGGRPVQYQTRITWRASVVDR